MRQNKRQPNLISQPHFYTCLHYPHLSDPHPRPLAEETSLPGPRGRNLTPRPRERNLTPWPRERNLTPLTPSPFWRGGEKRRAARQGAWNPGNSRKEPHPPALAEETSPPGPLSERRRGGEKQRAASFSIEQARGAGANGRTQGGGTSLLLKLRAAWNIGGEQIQQIKRNHAFAIGCRKT